MRANTFETSDFSKVLNTPGALVRSRAAGEPRRALTAAEVAETLRGGRVTSTGVVAKSICQYQGFVASPIFPAQLAGLWNCARPFLEGPCRKDATAFKLDQSRY